MAVEFVVEVLARGWTVEQALRGYDLRPEDVKACLAYAAEVLDGERVFRIPA